jgi:hypothetical protein
MALAMANGLTLCNPLLGGPVCQFNSSALARISADGSALEFATCLDNCSVPGIAFGRDGSLYVGVSPYLYLSGDPTGVLRLDTSSAPAIALDQISNAFRGNTADVISGGLYSLAGSDFQTPAIDLRLNAQPRSPDGAWRGSGDTRRSPGGNRANEPESGDGCSALRTSRRLHRRTAHFQ